MVIEVAVCSLCPVEDRPVLRRDGQGGFMVPSELWPMVVTFFDETGEPESKDLELCGEHSRQARAFFGAAPQDLG